MIFTSVFPTFFDNDEMYYLKIISYMCGNISAR